MKVKKFSEINETLDDDKTEYSISVEVHFKTTKEKEDAKSAIKKGIYWGLDVKNISSPKDVKINFI